MIPIDPNNIAGCFSGGDDMLSRGESAKWAYADLLPHIIADAEAAVR